MNRKTIALAAVALGAGIGGAGLAYAGSAGAGEKPEASEQGDEQQEAQLLAGARISLAQAVQAAEARTGMKAHEAGIGEEGGQPYFEVSVGQGQQEQDVLVDTRTGQVTKVVADSEEGEDEDG